MRRPFRVAPSIAALVLVAACGGSSEPSPKSACVVPSDCGADDACRVRTCVSGVCGTANVAAGTPLAQQVAGDCREDRCDGTGNVVSVALDSDLPRDDGQECTWEACSDGAPVHPFREANTPCGQDLGSFCDGAGACVQCTAASQCPGTDTECQARTCVANACGTAFAIRGTIVSLQTTGDCQQSQCDGTAGVMSVALDTDVPADEGNQCTAETCSAGVPVHPNLPVNTSCNQSGGSYCSSTGACVACTAASQCLGSDTECQTRTCVANVCGFSFAAAGTVVSTQTPGDCQENQCNGSGAVVSVAKSADVPADDGNQCTAEACVGGVPVHPNLPVDTACNQSGGSYCSSTGACVACTAASQCPGSDTACRTRTCLADVCGVSVAAVGTPVSNPTPGDCHENQCDSSGNVVSAVDNSDVPPDDGNQCTAETCSAGVSLHPVLPADTACSQNGGTHCNASGACVADPVAVATVSPANGTIVDPTTTVVVTFNAAMIPATLAAQTLTGACAGSIQLSADAFATCAAFGSAAPAMSAGNAVATLVPAPGLLVNRAYQLRVTTAATAVFDVPLLSQFLSGFGTSSRGSANNESGAVAEADYCTVQFPLSLTVEAGHVTALIYGQVYESGVTEPSGPSSQVIAQLGFGPSTSNPEYELGWTWTLAAYSAQLGNVDEYAASFTAPASGEYRYAYRFSLDGGGSWTYCDANQGDAGAGSNPGLTFDLVNLPVLTVP